MNKGSSLDLAFGNVNRGHSKVLKVFLVNFSTSLEYCSK
jgi:hypothetical protein